MAKITPITKIYDEDEGGGQDLLDKLDSSDYQQVIRIARRTSNIKDHSTTIQFRAPKIYTRFTEIFKERAKCRIETVSDASRSIYLLGIKVAKKFIDEGGKIGDGIDEMLAVNERLENILNRQGAYKEYGNILKGLKEYMKPYIKNKAGWEKEIKDLRTEIEKMSDEFLRQDLMKKFNRRVERVKEELESEIEEDS